MARGQPSRWLPSPPAPWASPIQQLVYALFQSPQAMAPGPGAIMDPHLAQVANLERIRSELGRMGAMVGRFPFTQTGEAMDRYALEFLTPNLRMGRVMAPFGVPEQLAMSMETGMPGYMGTPEQVLKILRALVGR